MQILLQMAVCVCVCVFRTMHTAPVTRQEEQYIHVTPASSRGKGMELSRSPCLCGLHFSLVFKPHIVPDLLPIAGSKLIMQLLLIKQRRYIFISIRFLIPQYIFFQEGKAALRWGDGGSCQVGWSWRCLSPVLAEPAPLMFLSQSLLGDSCTELSLGSSSVARRTQKNHIHTV